MLRVFDPSAIYNTIKGFLGNLFNDQQVTFDYIQWRANDLFPPAGATLPPAGPADVTPDWTDAVIRDAEQLITDVYANDETKEENVNE